MSQIHVSIQEIRDTAITLRKLNDELGRCLQDMLAQMNYLEDSWSSVTSQTIRDKFNALAPHFEQYASVIDSYANYLETTATNYEATEATLHQNASSMQ